ncbi:MAG: hypothetical protein Kow0068_10850 [Marinilabiliales bacterium]
MKKDNLQNIKDILNDYISDYGLNKKLNDVKIRSEWSNLVGTYIDKITTKMYIKDDILFVYLKSSVARHELFLIKTPLLKRINEISDTEIKDIRFL